MLMKSDCIISEIKKINKVFIGMSVISIFLSVFVLNLIYIYDNSYIAIKDTILIDYIEVNNILSGQVALFMPILCIIATAFIWTVDFETGCITYIFLGTTRKNWAIGKIIVSGIIVIFFYVALGTGLTVVALLLGNDIMNTSYLKQLLLLVGAAIPVIIWILFTGIISITCKEFGKTVTVTLGVFLISYILENYFTSMKGILPTSSIIYIWGYNDLSLLFKNIINVIFYICILATVLVMKVKKREV